jgi:hypothetical protein
MGKWIVTNEAGVEAHAATSLERAEAWASANGEGGERFNIDEADMKGEEHRAWIEATAAALGLSVTAEFVPFSQSRNKGEAHKSFNYQVTLARNGKPILTTDYSMGVAHSPSYDKQTFGKVSGYYERSIRAGIEEKECETGRTHHYNSARDEVMRASKAVAILPEPADVLHALAMDSDVLNYSAFENWAYDLGMDPDSRSGEKIYRACLEIALKLRNGLGEDNLAKLREACEGY